MVSSRHSEDPAKHPHLRGTVAIFRLLVTFIAQHSLPYVRAGLIMASYTFALSRRGIFRSYNTPVNFLQLDQAARTRRSTSLSMVPSLSITDPRYLKWSTFFSWSPFTFIGNGFSLVERCSVFATLILRPLSVNTFCHGEHLEDENDQQENKDTHSREM